MSLNYTLLIVPFSDESREKVKEMNLSVTKPDGLEFVFSELNQILNSNHTFEKLDNTFLENYFVFYPYARIMLSKINKSQFYEAFGKFYYSMVLKESENNEIEFLDLLNLKYELSNNYFLINFKDYSLAKITSEKDKLVNKAVKNGFVWLTKKETSDFIARYVATKVIEGLPLNVKNINPDFDKYAKKIKLHLEKKRAKFKITNTKVDFECMPSCLQNILNDLLSGGKPTHMERYYLATYLFSLNMELEGVLEIFSKASDYKEDIAKYQLKKIKDYAPPSFSTLRSMGLCTDSEFDKYKSPVSYYWSKMKRKEIKKEKEVN